MSRILITLAAIAVVFLLAGCKADGLRKDADRYDAVADRSDAVADAVARTFATADQALAWATDPVNQSIISLLPQRLQDRVNAVIVGGGDLRPVLASAAYEIRGIGDELRDGATRLREQADSEDTAFNNFLAAIGVGSAALGGVGLAIGRALGIGLGAARVTGVINAGRREDPAFNAAFEGPAGKEMRKVLEQQGATVKKAVLEHKKS